MVVMTEKHQFKLNDQWSEQERHTSINKLFVVCWIHLEFLTILLYKKLNWYILKYGRIIIISVDGTPSIDFYEVSQRAIKHFYLMLH